MPTRTTTDFPCCPCDFRSWSKQSICLKMPLQTVQIERLVLKGLRLCLHSIGPLSIKDYNISDKILKKFTVHCIINSLINNLGKKYNLENSSAPFSCCLSSLLGSPPALTMLLPVGVMKYVITFTEVTCSVPLLQTCMCVGKDVQICYYTNTLKECMNLTTKKALTFFVCPLLTSVVVSFDRPLSSCLHWLQADESQPLSHRMGPLWLGMSTLMAWSHLRKLVNNP